MPRKRYRTISIPEELVEKIEQVVAGGYGYTSLSEFVKECLRNRLRELGFSK